MKYGEKEIANFDVDKDFELWENTTKYDYMMRISLLEFTCLCPRSGYPDFAKIYIDYVPNTLVVELKALKLYINSFRNRHISHENSANEIFELLLNKLAPKYLHLKMDFNPRGNVHTVIELDSNQNAQNPYNLCQTFKKQKIHSF